MITELVASHLRKKLGKFNPLFWKELSKNVYLQQFILTKGNKGLKLDELKYIFY